MKYLLWLVILCMALILIELKRIGDTTDNTARNVQRICIDVGIDPKHIEWR